MENGREIYSGLSHTGMTPVGEEFFIFRQKVRGSWPNQQ